MPRTSQTELAVLGALSVEPMTGYQIRSAIEHTLSSFWAESYGQIYPTLTRLEEAGHIIRAADGRTSGSLFTLTESGRIVLRQLLSTPADPAPRRNGLLLRLFFGDQLGPDACRSMLQRAEAQTEEALALYARQRAEIEAEDPTPGRPYRLMTLSAGEHAARSTLAWIKDCREELRSLEPPSTAPLSG